jgi:hypothetical protein
MGLFNGSYDLDVWETGCNTLNVEINWGVPLFLYSLTVASSCVGIYRCQHQVLVIELCSRCKKANKLRIGSLMDIMSAIWGVAYATRGLYSHPWRFANYVCSGSQKQVPSVKDVRDFLDMRHREIGQIAIRRPVTNESALAVLVVRDIERVVETVNDRLSDAELHEDYLESVFGQVCTIFAAYGLDVGEATLRIQDSFPDPYRETAGWAMSYDVSDRKKYGIKPGVVLSRKYLMPLYTPALLAHELTHTALGQVCTTNLARGLEEGLAEFFGTLVVGGEVVGSQVSEAILINSRLRYPQDDQFGRMYAEAVRQAAVLVLSNGWEGVLELLRRGNRLGRGQIKDAERSLLLQTQEPPNSAGQQTGQPTTFARKFISYPQSLVVSPLSLWLAERVRIGDRVNEFLIANEVDPESGHAALSELQQRVNLVVVFDGQVTVVETMPFLESNTLRYEIAR